MLEGPIKSIDITTGTTGEYDQKKVRVFIDDLPKKRELGLIYYPLLPF